MQSKEKNMDLTSTENEAAKKAKKADKWADKPAMEVRDLHFSYGKNKVLKGVSLKIEEGKISTIMGERMWKIHPVLPDDEELISGERKYLPQGKEYPEPELKRICPKGSHRPAV